MRHLILYYNTIRFLKFKQLFFQLWYRGKRLVWKTFRFRYSFDHTKEGFPLHIIDFIHKYISAEGINSFHFLNKTSEFTIWDDERHGKLWSFNLNYMDFLLQDNLSLQKKFYWINKFIIDLKSNKNGLEPYPIALRGVNWIKFFSKYYLLIPPENTKNWNTSLYNQYRILSDNLEYHLLGNHLLEDAFSLLWAALYFKDNFFYEQATQLLYSELEEQILPDGAHYELTPMYHEILLDRLLDCINAAKYNMRFDQQKYIVKYMESKAIKMLGWLEAIIYTDGSMPLFNDSTYGIAPIARDLFLYAKRLGLTWSKENLKESGYRKFESSGFEMVLDVGNIGPDYIPGHAHADTFNYELRIDGKPFIIDSGISTYEKNVRRQYERETQAHNTVRVAGQSSSNVWGGFRVAQRAKITYLKEERNSITARHNGFRQLGVEHQRRFNMKNREITIEDQLIPAKGAKGINYIHLHPDVTILSVNTDSVKTDRGTISFSGADKVWIESCEIAFEYNKLIPTKKICLAFTNQMQYTIRHNIQ